MDYREENGKFTSRSQLLKVAKLGPKAFEQCAGFMRISDGKNPLDATGVHPESYDATKAVLEKLGFTMVFEMPDIYSSSETDAVFKSTPTLFTQSSTTPPSASESFFWFISC